MFKHVYNIIEGLVIAQYVWTHVKILIMREKMAAVADFFPLDTRIMKIKQKLDFRDRLGYAFF